MQTVGCSLLFFALFYYIIDVLGYKKWAFAFQVIGVNSILIYLSEKFIEWEYTAKKFFDWVYQWAGDPTSIIFVAIAILLIKWLSLKFLYDKKVFLRVLKFIFPIGKEALAAKPEGTTLRSHTPVSR